MKMYSMEKYQKEKILLCKTCCREVDLIGYCPWSFIDLVSTHQGYEKHYGFVYVNREEKDLKDN